MLRDMAYVCPKGTKTLFTMVLDQGCPLSDSPRMFLLETLQQQRNTEIQQALTPINTCSTYVTHIAQRVLPPVAIAMSSSSTPPTHLTAGSFC